MFHRIEVVYEIIWIYYVVTSFHIWREFSRELLIQYPIRQPIYDKHDLITDHEWLIAFVNFDYSSWTNFQTFHTSNLFHESIIMTRVQKLQYNNIGVNFGGVRIIFQFHFMWCIGTSQFPISVYVFLSMVDHEYWILQFFAQSAIHWYKFDRIYVISK